MQEHIRIAFTLSPYSHDLVVGPSISLYSHDLSIRVDASDNPLTSMNDDLFCRLRILGPKLYKVQLSFLYCFMNPVSIGKNPRVTQLFMIFFYVLLLQIVLYHQWDYCFEMKHLNFVQIFHHILIKTFYLSCWCEDESIWKFKLFFPPRQIP